MKWPELCERCGKEKPIMCLNGVFVGKKCLDAAMAEIFAPLAELRKVMEG